MQDSQGGPTLASHRHPQNGTGAFVLIRFNPQASVSRHQQVPGGAQGVDRRRPGGRQRPVPPQASPEKPVGQAELGAIVKRMQGNPVVGFTVPPPQ